MYVLYSLKDGVLKLKTTEGLKNQDEEIKEYFCSWTHIL